MTDHDPELFACSGESGMTEDGEVFYTRVMLILADFQKERGMAPALEIANAIIRAGADYVQLNVGPVSSRDLVQAIANEKWRAMSAARKRRVQDASAAV